MVYESTFYTSVFDKIDRNSDTSYLVTYKIENYRKVIYADSIFLHQDTMSNFKIVYTVLLNGEYKNIFASDRIAALEGYYYDDQVFTFDDYNNRKPKGNIFNIYKSGSYYRDINEIKMKLFPELYWLHLFPSIKKAGETYKSSQALFLDMKSDRIPSVLTYKSSGKEIQIHMEVDYLEIYKGMVSEEDLKTIAFSGPDDFFFRISSEGTYQWDHKLNVPKSISAKLTTTVKDKPENITRVDTYNIKFSPK
jgi:hypothetical protein